MDGKFAKDWYSKKLDIPIDEIVTEYRQARNKNKQIEILADLCGTKACRIAWILDRCGLAVDVKKMPRAQRNPAMPDYVAFWTNSEEAVICGRLRKQMQEAQSMPEFDAEKEAEVLETPIEKEENIIRRLEEAVEAEEGKRLKYTKPEKEPDRPIEIPAKPLAEVGDHGVYRIVGELWSIYLEKLRRRGVNLLGTAEVLKMQDLERIVHEIVEGM